MMLSLLYVPEPASFLAVIVNVLGLLSEISAGVPVMTPVLVSNFRPVGRAVAPVISNSEASPPLPLRVGSLSLISSPTA